MTDVIGPGIGTFIGQSFGEAANQCDHLAAQKALQRGLMDANCELLMSTAVKDAAKALLNAVMSEQIAATNGKLKARHYSAPANVKARNNAFVETAVGQLGRLSDNALGFSVMSKNVVKASRKELGALLRSPATCLNGYVVKKS